MSKWILVVVVLAVLSSAFAGGWYVRGLRADAVQATTAATHEAARADGARAVTANDRENARSAADIEAHRVRRAQRREVIFNQLQKEVADYADDQIAHAVRMGPALVAGCCDRIAADARGRGPADADFMRIWRAANAGRFAPTQSDDPARPNPASKAAAATNRER